jgi:hypothetical protein
MKPDIEICEYCGSEAVLSKRIVAGETAFICDLCYEAETKEKRIDVLEDMLDIMNEH